MDQMFVVKFVPERRSSYGYVAMRKFCNRNRKLQTSKAPLKSQAQGTSLFTSAASNEASVMR